MEVDVENGASCHSGEIVIYLNNINDLRSITLFNQWFCMLEFIFVNLVF